MERRSAKGSKKRRSGLRLEGYDYSSAGAYFVTVCTAGRTLLFGDVSNEEMVENPYAKFLRRCWKDLPKHYTHVTLDAFVIMPNHLHGIIALSSEDGAETNPTVGAGFKPARQRPEPAPTGLGDAPNAPTRRGLPEIVRALKTYSARRINAARGTPGMTVWQRDYYEHIIRGEGEMGRIREYIVSNPRNWRRDRDYVPKRPQGQGRTGSGR